MPTGGSGGGPGFMFAGEAHCWFADNKPEVCGNISGCAYCVAGSGPKGILNATSICYNKQAGFCEGHNAMEGSYPDANNSANLACSDIRIRSACNFGPLSMCSWTNSSAMVGAYCQVGASTGQKSAPPAQYCEDPVAKNNYMICMQLANDFMMPCKWQNATFPITNCTFNGNAVFGFGGEETDFGIINNQFSCTAAGGTWQTEYYVDESILKQDSWCEMTGFFDVDQGKGQANKGNCDTSCWACEFQENGTAWPTATAAEAACSGSALGSCRWKNDTGNMSFSKQGWCDFPKEMENAGGKDCNSECKGCDFMNNPRIACEGSMANDGEGCKWVNDSTNLVKGGYCVDKTKKTCSSDCFSCFNSASCVNNTLECNWDPTFNLCKPTGFMGEICFNGVDDDSDALVDCSDPDCGFDNFCGGSSFGGDCFSKTSSETCVQTAAFAGLNCTWLTDTWNSAGWCDMPGANCWKFNNNLTGCGITPGCTNQSSSMGDDAWCEMNMTRMNTMNCWQGTNASACSQLTGCMWKNNTWPGAPAGSGFCDNFVFAACSSLMNSSSCNLNTNCTWKQDNYSMMGGWCDVACMNQNWNQDNCENVSLNGLCQWKNMSQTCQPSTFMMFGAPSSGGGMGGGGFEKKGCWQYDGNQTGCLANNVICSYKNDSFARNNRSTSEPSGWCMDKGEFEHFGNMDVGEGIVMLGQDSDNPVNVSNPLDVLPESGVDGAVDILRFGMKVNDKGFDFGIETYDINQSVMCNGFVIKGPIGGTPYVGAGTDTGKFYWYLDTNGNTNGGCSAVQAEGNNLTGFDFMISYVARNSSNGVVETKQLMRCVSGAWTPTNAYLTTSKKISCGEIEGVMLAVAKQDLESFTEYNKTATMRIFVASAGESESLTSPADSLGPGYYTPGAVDFTFVDCSNPANSNDPKCKNFKKFGFNVFEECKNGVDDDENDLVDCDDPFCKFMPICNGGTGFSFVANANDTTAPVVMFSDIEKLYDAVFIRIDTNEPSNLSLVFYKNDSSCMTANNTLIDSGSGFQANANFKPFHSADLMLDSLGFALANGTTYYYKTTLCDPSSNCAVSACLNFTTKSTVEDKSFIFKIELPDGYTIDIPALNKTNYNFSENFGGTLYEVGVKTNTSVTRDINFTVHCGNMSIGFYGVNMLEPTKIDLSRAFICDEDENLIGMNSSLKKWNKLIDDLHLGSASDYIEIGIPVAYDNNNVLNWTDDSGANGEDVNDYVNCSGNSTKTSCKIPVSMGFSAYTITSPQPAGGDDNNNNGGGGGGGGGLSDYTISAAQLSQGYSKVLVKGEKIKFSVNNQNHTLTLSNLTSTNVVIIINSTPQIATLLIGETKKFEINNDLYYDLLVKLNSINNTKANITLSSIYEKISPQQDQIVQEDSDDKSEESGKDTKENITSLKNKLYLFIIGGFLILLIIALVIYFKNKK
jgi:hypothetical protein